MSPPNLPADESLATTGTGVGVGGGGRRSHQERPSYKLQLTEYVNSQFDGDRLRTCEVISRPAACYAASACPPRCAPTMHPRAICRLLASCTRCSVDALVLGLQPSG